jgi:hypothetical protein
MVAHTSWPFWSRAQEAISHEGEQGQSDGNVRPPFVFVVALVSWCSVRALFLAAMSSSIVAMDASCLDHLS